MGIKRYLHNALVGLDQFTNTLLGGMPGETVSARAGRAKHKRKLWGKLLGGVLNKIQSGHTEGAEAKDMERAEKVEDQEAEDLHRDPN